MVTNQRRNSNPIPFLHEEIIYNVLLLLPVVDLLRSKSVCKLWLSLISSPDFVKSHLYKSKNDPQFTHHHLLLSCKVNNSPFQLIKSCSIYSLLKHEPVNEAIEIACPDRITSVVGSCNGLICLRCYDDYLFFWNPSTRQSRRLPKIDIPLIYRRYAHYGFCYDELNDEFKVFVIFTSDGKHNKMSVYSSKSDSWRLIGDFVSISLRHGGYLGYGALNWVGFHFRPLVSSNIVSVDIKTETYREVPLPYFGEGNYSWNMVNFAESLSVLCNMFEDSQVDIWVMKKCDGVDFWIKLLTIPHMDRLNEDSYIQPICISMNGDIMLHLDESIILYNSRDHTFKDLLNNISSEGFTQYPYVESLVSPHL